MNALEDRLLYRVTEVAVFLNLSRSKVYELLGSGALPSVKSTAQGWSAAPTYVVTSSRLGRSAEPLHSVRRYELDQLIRSDLPVIRVRASRFF